MSQIFAPITALFKFHKLKILGALAFAVLFTLWIFPYDDLADLATSKVSQITNNQVYVAFDSLDLGFLPPSVSMGNVSVETQTMPAIKAERLNVAPWLAGLITGKQGASVDASSLFGGAVALDFHQGDKTKSGERINNIGLTAAGLKLPEVAKFLAEGNLGNVLLQGLLSTDKFDLAIDPSFIDQPTGDISLSIKNLALPSQTIRTQMMPISVPDLKFGDTKLKAKISDGKLDITDFSFGNATTLAGKINGTVSVRFLKSAAGIQPLIQSYNLNIDLKMPTEFEKANQSVLSALYGFVPPTSKRVTAKGVELAFSMSPPQGSSMFPTFGPVLTK